MNTFYADIKKARTNLESQSIDSANTSDTIALITQVQNLKKQLKTSQEEVKNFNLKFFKANLRLTNTSLGINC